MPIYSCGSGQEYGNLLLYKKFLKAVKEEGKKEMDQSNAHVRLFEMLEENLF